MRSRFPQTIPPNPRKRTLIFIDLANLTNAVADIGRAIEWPSFKQVLAEGREVLEILVYAGLPPATTGLSAARTRMQNLLRTLEMLGYLVVRKEGKPRDAVNFKANVDVMMALDAAELAVTIRPEVVILVTGDGDFAHLALKLRRLGIRVEVMAIEGTNLADELKAAANAVIDLEKVVRKAHKRITVTRVTGPIPSDKPAVSTSAKVVDGKQAS
jgi:uncharacterized LabA/DUF88 family protein